MIEALNNNLLEFLHSVDDVESYSKEILEEIITDEIKSQYAIKTNKKRMSVSGDCEDSLDSATENCGENYSIAMGVVVISGFITLGWGTVLGTIGAAGVLVKCSNDAAAAYRDCVNESKKK